MADSIFQPLQFKNLTVKNRVFRSNIAGRLDKYDKIPFWRKVGEEVHKFDCKYIMQLSHGGRQRDVPGIEYPMGLSSTSKADPLHGFECQAMTKADIQETVNAFAEGARRAREAGLDGVELH